jgi:segregation and condensation protein B
VSRDYDPEQGQWYEDLDREEVFKVLSVDPDDELLRIQWLDGEVEEIDLDDWAEMDLELAEEPEGWADEDEDEEVDDEDEEEDEDWDDEDEDEDEDDWDEDDEDEDWDDLDEDDDYRDRD